jgi:hypothetical protein
MLILCRVLICRFTARATAPGSRLFPSRASRAARGARQYSPATATFECTTSCRACTTGQNAGRALVVQRRKRSISGASSQ